MQGKADRDRLRFPTNRSLIWFLLKGSLRYSTAGAVCACLVALFDLVIPRLIQYTVDAVVGNDLSSVPAWAAGLIMRFGGAGFLRTHLWAAALAVAACAAAGALFRYGFKAGNERGAEVFVERTRNELFSRILSLPYSWTSGNSTGDIIQRCTSDVETVKIFVSEQLTSLLRVFILVFMSLYFMASIQWKLTLAAALFILIMIASSLFFYGLIGDEFEKVDSEEGRLSAIAQENLTGVRVVRTFGREMFEKERFEVQNELFTDHWIRLMKVLAAFWVSGNVIATVRNMTIAVFGTVLCVRGQLTAGGFIAFLSYNALMSLPVRSIGRVIADMSKTGVSIERLRYIMNAVPEEEDGGEPSVLTPPMDGDIVFSDVRFRFGEDLPWVLKGVSMKIRAGTTVGILGATGTGKTTLALLLDRLYELQPGWGRITVGGVDLCRIDRSWLRKNIGMVLQEPFLFSRTLKENIAIAADVTDRTDEKAELWLHRAVRTAALDEAVSRFADGYGTFVGERGVTLSGGQKQRTAIAQTPGAGKSTLVNLVCRFYEPTGGQVLIDGRDARERSQLWLHSSIGYVLQTPYLFSGTVRDNLRYGRQDASDQEIREALRLASADFVVDHMEKGLDSEVGEGGGMLSTGQKQLLSIARAILANPRILILDEATSSVDTVTERAIQEATSALVRGRTAFIIAHRLSTIAGADVILAVRDGKVVERGTHRELMKKRGYYFSLYQAMQ